MYKELPRQHRELIRLYRELPRQHRELIRLYKELPTQHRELIRLANNLAAVTQNSNHGGTRRAEAPLMHLRDPAS